MSASARSRRREAAGQILVLFALAAVAIISMVGLVLDGGGAFAQRRVEQNAADLSAIAGANAYLNTSGNAAARSAAADTAARAVATRNQFTHGAEDVDLDVTVSLLAAGADVTVSITKPHINTFARIVPGQETWDVSVTATATAGVIDTAVGAAPWTMSIDAFEADGSPTYTSTTAFGTSNGDYPEDELDIAWTDYNGENNVNTNEVRRIIDGRTVITATFDFGQYLGQHNNGHHTALYSDVNTHLVGSTVPVPIVGPGPCVPGGQSWGCFKGWALFHVVSASGGSAKDITGYFIDDFRSSPLTVGECTPPQQAAGQCGDIPASVFDNLIVRLTE